MPMILTNKQLKLFNLINSSFKFAYEADKWLKKENVTKPIDLIDDKSATVIIGLLGEFKKERMKKSQLIGIYYHPKSDKWEARISYYNSSNYIGMYDSEKEALDARNQFIIDNKLKNKLQKL